MLIRPVAGVSAAMASSVGHWVGRRTAVLLMSVGMVIRLDGQTARDDVEVRVDVTKVKCGDWASITTLPLGREQKYRKTTILSRYISVNFIFVLQIDDLGAWPTPKVW